MDKSIFERFPVFYGESLKEISFPLGGIGTGTISINGYGELVEWQIFNNVDSSAQVNHTFFAIRIEENGKVVAKLLQKHKKLPKKELWWKHETLVTLPKVRDIVFRGLYPIVFLEYVDEELPVKVELEAFNPFVPLDEKNSALPLVFFIFKIRNTSSRKVKASVLFSMQNPVGYDGHSEYSDTRFKGFGRNVNKLVNLGGYKGIYMYSESLSENDPKYGNITILSLSKKTRINTKWVKVREFWLDFVQKGLLEAKDETPSPKGRTWNVALESTIELEPGEDKEIVFLLAWYFPNRIIDWDTRVLGARVGNMYNNWFKNSLEVAEYGVKNYRRLRKKTEDFVESFYNIDIPSSLVFSAGSQISTIRTPTYMWLEDGTIAAFEGCGRKTGCCPMNCTHVYNYAHVMAFFFPELEKNVRKIDFGIQLEENGLMHHRLALPLTMPRRSGLAVDGQLGTILKFYREVLYTGDLEMLKRFWPRVRLALDYIIEKIDRDRDGVLEGYQPNTYDCVIYGPNTFIGTLYLATLKAAIKMAQLVGDEDAARKYLELFNKGSRKLYELTWNGEYFVHREDLVNYEEERKRAEKDPWVSRWAWCFVGHACLSDQLLGQWWAHILDLGYLLPKESVRKALKSIYKYNFKRTLKGHIHGQRVYVYPDESGLLNATWPHGGRPEEPIWYCDEVWTGIEYEVAALMVYEGLLEEALDIINAVRKRYNGKTGNPWNELECGEHYARPMSSWTLILAAQGYHYNGVEKVLKIKPAFQNLSKGFFITPTAWGTFIRDIDRGKLQYIFKIKYGKLKISKIMLEPTKGTIVEVEADSQKINATLEKTENYTKIILEKPLEVAECLTVRIR